MSLRSKKWWFWVMCITVFCQLTTLFFVILLIFHLGSFKTCKNTMCVPPCSSVVQSADFVYKHTIEYSKGNLDFVIRITQKYIFCFCRPWKTPWDGTMTTDMDIGLIALFIVWRKGNIHQEGECKNWYVFYRL